MDQLIGGVIYPYPVYFANITGVDLTNFERTEVALMLALSHDAILLANLS